LNLKLGVFLDKEKFGHIWNGLKFEVFLIDNKIQGKIGITPKVGFFLEN